MKIKRICAGTYITDNGYRIYKKDSTGLWYITGWGVKLIFTSFKSAKEYLNENV